MSGQSAAYYVAVYQLGYATGKHGGHHADSNQGMSNAAASAHIAVSLPYALKILNTDGQSSC